MTTLTLQSLLPSIAHGTHRFADVGHAPADYQALRATAEATAAHVEYVSTLASAEERRELLLSAHASAIAALASL